MSLIHLVVKKPLSIGGQTCHSRRNPRGYENKSSTANDLEQYSVLSNDSHSPSAIFKYCWCSVMTFLRQSTDQFDIDGSESGRWTESVRLTLFLAPPLPNDFS